MKIHIQPAKTFIYIYILIHVDSLILVLHWQILTAMAVVDHRPHRFWLNWIPTNQPTNGHRPPAPPSIPTSHPHLQARPQTAPGFVNKNWVSLADFFPSNTSRNQALAGYNQCMLDVIINKLHIITYRINTSVFGLLFTRFPLTWETRIEVFHFLGLGEFIGRPSRLASVI